MNVKNTEKQGNIENTLLMHDPRTFALNPQIFVRDPHSYIVHEHSYKHSYMIHEH